MIKVEIIANKAIEEDIIEVLTAGRILPIYTRFSAGADMDGGKEPPLGLKKISSFILKWKIAILKSFQRP